ncbi:MAG: glycogen synthase GlgA [Planctomycetes bacterium]|nr:glycogen synthase GlgA [Planctomycetota bacterium]
MNILLASSEAIPFAKTGGLADVAGTLPAELARLGHRAALIMPAYRRALKAGLPIEATGLDFEVQLGSRTVAGTLLRSQLPGTDVPVYLVRQDQYYDRDELYGAGGIDYEDNCERFVFFCRAVFQAIRLLKLPVDVIHANDWQTGLLPALLKIEHRGRPGFERVASLLTIHNMAYQGQFWHWDMTLTGLDWKYFNWHQMEFYGKLNLLKTGLTSADALNTVSPRYAEEIQTPAFGCGLEGVLQARRNVLSGIINGVDYGVWNPAIDSQLPEMYDATTVERGKPACKAWLQQELNLPVDPRVPLIGFVGRLAEQKGLDLISNVLPDWMHSSPAQWVFLGTGEPRFHQLLTEMAARCPQKLAVQLKFSDAMAHRIEAGSDIFLMPSRFEPCGLNQLYSLKYGTVPVVHATGGLANTVTDCTDVTLADGTATGFTFDEYDARVLSATLGRACELYGRPEQWSKLMQNGMRQDWSWGRSAREYVALYESMLARI